MAKRLHIFMSGNVLFLFVIYIGMIVCTILCFLFHYLYLMCESFHQQFSNVIFFGLNCSMKIHNNLQLEGIMGFIFFLLEEQRKESTALTIIRVFSFIRCKQTSRKLSRCTVQYIYNNEIPTRQRK